MSKRSVSGLTLLQLRVVRVGVRKQQAPQNVWWVWWKNVSSITQLVVLLRMKISTPLNTGVSQQHWQTPSLFDVGVVRCEAKHLDPVIPTQCLYLCRIVSSRVMTPLGAIVQATKSVRDRRGCELEGPPKWISHASFN